MSVSRREKSITKTYRIDGIGSVLLTDGSIRDVDVVGVIAIGQWDFIVHHDLLEPQYLTVSEASSGVQLKKGETYYEFEDAVYYALPFLDRKYYYLHGRILEFLIQSQKDLTIRNMGLMTPAIHTALWL